MKDPNTFEQCAAPEAPAADRNTIIVRTSIIGIAANVLLAAFKAAVGLLSHSIAIVLDAVNNISDAASSVITIIGTKLAGKAPDKKHPFGHGRIEYLSAMLISGIVLYAGISSLISSVKKIIHPEKPEYTAVSLVIVVAAVAVKIVLGLYVKKTGIKVNSDSLVNSGKDALLDSVISASTLVAAVIFMITGVSLEAWLGAVISAVIIKSGIEMLRETISRILGEKIDIGTANDIKKTVCSFSGVSGAYDLVLNNYGPDTVIGSIHIEVPDTMNANDLDELLREIMIEVYRKHNVILTAIGVYSINTTDEHIAEMRRTVTEKAMSYEHVLQIHGFYVNEEKKTMRFDVVVSLEAKDRDSILKSVTEGIKELYPDFTLQVAMDIDFAEE